MKGPGLGDVPSPLPHRRGWEEAQFAAVNSSNYAARKLVRATVIRAGIHERVDRGAAAKLCLKYAPGIIASARAAGPFPQVFQT
jgi:hypothetical protein